MATRKNVQTVKILSDQENPEPLEVIAESIIQIADAFTKLNNSKVKQRVIVLLIKDHCRNISVSDIEQILDTIPKLKSLYLKQR